MNAEPNRIVVVHGPSDPDLDAALELAGLRPAIVMEQFTVWRGADPGPSLVGAVAPPPSSAGPERLLLTVLQAAAVLGIGRTTAYQLIRSGDMEVVHVGRLTRIPADSLPAVVERLRSSGIRPRVGRSRPPGRVGVVGRADLSQPPAARTPQPA